MRQKYDELWKGVLEELFEDFLRFVFPCAGELFDFGREFEFLDKELNEMYPKPGAGPNNRFVDKLVKVFLKNGQEQWILVHIEVQCQKDKLFTERMFQYYYRLFDRYRQPVTAIAIFTGKDGKSMPDRYTKKFMGIELSYKYNTICLSDYTDNFLKQSDNAFALALLTAKKALLKREVTESGFLEIKLQLAALIWGKDVFTNGKLKAVLVFLENLLIFDKSETNLKFDREFDQITGQQNTMGVLEQLGEIKKQEGLEAGLKKGRKEAHAEARQLFVKKLLSHTEFSDKKIAELADVSIKLVKEIRTKLARK